MSRFSQSSTKLGRFLDRNDGSLISGLFREAGAKAMKRPAIRRVVSSLTPTKRPDKWLFIVGCYNSGTTVLRRVLESHPQIAGLPHEGVQMSNAFPDLEAGGWPRMMHRHRDLWDLPEEGAEARVEQAIKDWSPWWPRSAPIFLEKSIDHATRVRWLDRHFPNAYFIAITRNGYCVSEGIRRRGKPREEALAEIGEQYPISMVAEQWAAVDERLREDMPHVARGISLRYEDLVSDPVKHFERIFEFVGAEPISLSLDANVLNIGEDQHEILDQTDASLARLSEQDFAEATPPMLDALLRNGYTPMGAQAS